MAGREDGVWILRNSAGRIVGASAREAKDAISDASVRVFNGDADMEQANELWRVAGALLHNLPLPGGYTLVRDVFPTTPREARGG